MSRSRKIIEILEGFKLGKLGAGVKLAKPVPTDDSQNSADTPSYTGYKIARTNWTKQKRTFADFWVNAVSWTEDNPPEPNVYKFLMICRIIKDNESYQIQVFGGSNLKAFLTTSPRAVNVGFMAIYDYSASSDKEANAFFQSKFKRIAGVGSFGYALNIGKLDKGWKLLEQNADPTLYLLNTSGVSVSSYFSRG
jgi:hypothetical protein